MCHHSKSGKTIRKVHCVTAVSYLTNTNILMIYALRQATCTIPLECCSGLWLLGGDTLHWDSWWSFPHSLAPDSSLPSTVVSMGELVMKHFLTHSSSQQKPLKQRKAVVCKAISRPSVSCCSMDGQPWSDPQSVNLNPSDTPGWRVSQQLHFTSLGFREIPGQSLLIYIPKNLLHSYL